MAIEASPPPPSPLPPLPGLQGVPTAPGGQTPPPMPDIRDIAPPLDEIPWPMWKWALLVGGTALFLTALGVVIWMFVRAARQQPLPIPPSPRALAMRALDALRPRVRTDDGYPFAIAVSDVLRDFIGRQYGILASKQTSPEFLATVAVSRRFNDADHQLLAAFLEQVDLIKFARATAGEAENELLLSKAIAFVQGTRA